jgi:mRNA deadenylase 3'-5' endonuclease subunit Ccr4
MDVAARPAPDVLNEYRIGACTLHHTLRLRSAAPAVTGRELLHTAIHYRWRGTVDYIWFNGPFEAVAIASAVPVHVVDALRGFPNSVFSSDHIAVCAEFIWRDW